MYAEGQGIDPGVFIETVNSALFQSPFYAAYSKVMLNPPAEAGASVGLGEKDTRPSREAAASRGTRVRLADTLAENFAQAKAAGLGDQDWAVGMYRVSQRHGSLGR